MLSPRSWRWPTRPDHEHYELAWYSPCTYVCVRICRCILTQGYNSTSLSQKFCNILVVFEAQFGRFECYWQGHEDYRLPWYSPWTYVCVSMYVYICGCILTQGNNNTRGRQMFCNILVQREAQLSKSGCFCRLLRTMKIPSSPTNLCVCMSVYVCVYVCVRVSGYICVYWHRETVIQVWVKSFAILW